MMKMMGFRLYEFLFDDLGYSDWRFWMIDILGFVR